MASTASATRFSLAMFGGAALFAAGCGVVASSGTSGTGTGTGGSGSGSTTVANLQPYADPTGTVATFTTAGSIDLTQHFFQPMGSNGRTCASCHQLNQGLSLSASGVQALFASTSGADPLFNAVDGANCSTAAAGDATARSLLLQNGLIRVPVTLPANAQFTLTVTHDPYGCAVTKNTAGQQVVSVYRRPLMSASVNYLSNVMWDTRETISPLTTSTGFATNLTADLTQQLMDAVSTHEQGTTAPSAALIAEVLTMQAGFFTAQSSDTLASALNAGGATGGPTALAAQTYYPGINDAFGADPTGAAFNPAVFNLYGPWRNSTNAQQASINRGEAIFNTAPMAITGVRGINDNPALGSPNNLRGTCGTCHDAPNVGSHSLPLPMDTGTSRLLASETDPNILAGIAKLSAPDLPVFTITGCRDANNRPVTFVTSDPGKGLFTGQCADINRTKVPSLRGLAARAPYFHGGSVATLQQLVAFYVARFQMGLNAQQQADLVNFLNAL